MQADRCYGCQGGADHAFYSCRTLCASGIQRRAALDAVDDCFGGMSYVRWKHMTSRKTGREGMRARGSLDSKSQVETPDFTALKVARSHSPLPNRPDCSGIRRGQWAGSAAEIKRKAGLPSAIKCLLISPNSTATYRIRPTSAAVHKMVQSADRLA